MSLDKLFTPLKLGNLQFPNRIVMAPMTRMANPDHVPAAHNADYYARRAGGGTGLIITECTFINHPGANGYPGTPAFYGEALAGWRLVVDRVHAAGGLIMPQIWHAGPMRPPQAPPDPQAPAYGPMGVQVDGQEVCVAMTDRDIEAVVEAFAQAAADAKATGFDGVELHGAHSFLIDQFLWKKSNRRTDKYGMNRVEFAREIVAAVRESVGTDFPIVFRFSQWKQDDYEARIADNADELATILVPLKDAGVDIFHPSTRRFWEPAFEGSEKSLAAWTRQITQSPVIAVGSIGIDAPLDLSIFGGQAIQNHAGSLERLEQALERDDFDLVAVGRALIADPQWPNKIRGGHTGYIQDFNSELLADLY